MSAAHDEALYSLRGQWSGGDSTFFPLWSYAEPDANNAFAAVKPGHLGQWSTSGGSDELACACEYDELMAPTPAPTEVCPPGTYNSGQNVCLKCAPGKFTAEPGRTECSECILIRGPRVSLGGLADLRALDWLGC